jgi:hypothetical protein
MIAEMIRMIAIDAALVLALILTCRDTLLSRRNRTMLTVGIVLLLLEDATRWGISLVIGIASPAIQVQVDQIRQWVTLAGAAGAIVTCAALLQIAVRGTRLAAQA